MQLSIYNTILFISLSPYTWHHEIYTSIFDKDIIEAYKSDCFFNNHNVDFIYISIQEYEVVCVLVIARRAEIDMFSRESMKISAHPCNLNMSIHPDINIAHGV